MRAKPRPPVFTHPPSDQPPIPLDNVLEVFCILRAQNLRKDLKRCRLVCKVFSQLAATVIFTDFRVYRYERVQDVHHFLHGFIQANYISHLIHTIRIDSIPGVTLCMIAQLVMSIPNLRQLVIRYVEWEHCDHAHRDGLPFTHPCQLSRTWRTLDMLAVSNIVSGTSSLYCVMYKYLTSICRTRPRTTSSLDGTLLVRPYPFPLPVISRYASMVLSGRRTATPL